jgi:hypothetical protein
VKKTSGNSFLPTACHYTSFHHVDLTSLFRPRLRNKVIYFKLLDKIIIDSSLVLSITHQLKSVCLLKPNQAITFLKHIEIKQFISTAQCG